MVDREAEARKMYTALVEVHGDDVPLDRAALWLAAEEQPGLDVDTWLHELDRIAGEIAMPEHCEPIEAVARLNQHLFQSMDFQGDEETYDAPENSFINQVLERRRGQPILLSIIYIEVARRCGVVIDPIGFPQHFLISPRNTEPRFFVDPFHQGRVLREDELRARMAVMLDGQTVDDELLESVLAPVTPHQVLERINNNLKFCYLRMQDPEGAIRCVERNLFLAPHRPHLHQERSYLKKFMEPKQSKDPK